MEEQIKRFEEWQAKIIEMERAYKNEFEKYRAEMKQVFGIADGEQTNVLQLVKAAQKWK